MIPKYFLFDTETGGLPHQDPSLLSLYGILLDTNLNIIDEIDLLIKPDNGVYKVNAYALAINKIDLIKHNEKAYPECEASKIFHEFILKNKVNEAPQKVIPVGQNVGFDIHFMKLFYSNWNKEMNHRVLDTASIIQFLKLAGIITLPPDQEGSLKELADYFGIDTSDLHEAKFDTMLTLTMLKKYIELIQK